MAENSENQNENSEYVLGSIPLRSRSDSIAGLILGRHAIALPWRGRVDATKGSGGVG